MDHGASGRSSTGAVVPRVVMAVVLVSALAAMGLLGGWTRASPGPYSDRDVEYRLAAADEVRMSESQMDRFSRDLDRAQPACTQERDSIGDLVLAATRHAEARGADASTRYVIRELSTIPGPQRPTDCVPVIDEAVERAGRCQPFGARPCGY